MTQNSISIPSCAQTPKNPRKMSKTPPYSGLGAKPFLAPPPAKADIATAILTNVIEHLVLLFCPPISTPSPPKRCGRILILRLIVSTSLQPLAWSPARSAATSWRNGSWCLGSFFLAMASWLGTRVEGSYERSCRELGGSEPGFS